MVVMEPVLGKWGEKKLLGSIRKYLGKSRTIVRIFSEDCAVIDSGGKYYELLTVDSLIEGIHFRREYMPAYFIGRKAVKVNLSDISAMGGMPLHCMVSLGAPPKTPVRFIQEVYQGMDSVFKEEGISLIGGNVAASSAFFLDLFLVGKVPRKQVLFRSGAQEGDSVFVTGPVGGSAEGLRLLKKGFRLSRNGNRLIRPSSVRDSVFAKEAIMAHFDPPSSNQVARKLSGWKMLSSMIDLSDGIASDLREICRESGTGAVIDLARLPLAPALFQRAEKRKSDAMALALCGGEDYHLLFTVPGSLRGSFLIRSKKARIRVFEIGRILNRRQGIYTVTQSGKKKALPSGYEHFHGH